MKRKLLIAAILLCTITNLYSQTTKNFNDSGSVNEQFDNLIQNSNKYQDYKVVKLNWLLKLKSNINDSILASKEDILKATNTINKQQKTIDSLNTSFSSTKNEIATLKTQITTISFFGIDFEKGLFKTIMLSIIGGLLLFLLFFISKFKQSISITKQTKSNLKEVEDEYEQHRKKALEREQKVMRRLQDELNKQKKE
jgi:septal ring factor EnvC (AmiA/AmiB activator)